MRFFVALAALVIVGAVNGSLEKSEAECEQQYAPVWGSIAPWDEYSYCEDGDYITGLRLHELRCLCSTCALQAWHCTWVGWLTRFASTVDLTTIYWSASAIQRSPFRCD
jgi:hypothetical protein